MYSETNGTEGSKMSQADRAIQALNKVGQHIPDEEFVVIAGALGKLARLEEEAAARSWEGAVDRQSGAFTQDEIDAREQW